VNVALTLTSSARVRGPRAAILEPSGRRSFRATSFEELLQRCDELGHGLLARGVRPGDRVALFVRPGRELIAVTYALWKIGAVPVLLDPGMGRVNIARCLERTKPRVLIGVLLSHALRTLARRALASIEIALLVGPSWTGIETLASVARTSAGVLSAHPSASTDTAAILFTSGSTGAPKGVVYTHGIFAAQLEALRALYCFEPGERDLACFPLFALFDAALGTTAVIPRLDPLRPADCDPAEIVNAILAHGCTYGFGSPAIWRRVTPWAVARGVNFETLTRALIAGAPVSPGLIRDLRTRLAKGGDVHTPYGATECLPVSSISGLDFEDGLRERVEGGHGSCVGRAAPGIEIAIRPIEDGAVDRVEALPPNTIGEICVRGPVVTRSYADDDVATRRAKIEDGDTWWHRMGDAGYVDDAGLLWTVGRVAHGVRGAGGLQWPVMLENVCDLHPLVQRTALVSDGERPCLVVEPRKGARRSLVERERLLAEMRALLAAKQVSGAPAPLVAPERLIECGRLPVDVRHNAKIRREELSEWARERRT
jgi:acyl-CoA synthetase (AMP-forming)/AMP-acid ligase II